MLIWVWILMGRKERLEGDSCSLRTVALEDNQAYSVRCGHKMERFHSSKQSLETGGCCRTRQGLGPWTMRYTLDSSSHGYNWPKLFHWFLFPPNPHSQDQEIMLPYTLMAGEQRCPATKIRFDRFPADKSQRLPCSLIEILKMHI